EPLRGGGYLVCTPETLEQVAPNGRLVWQVAPGSMLQRTRTCLGLVRLGFPAPASDLRRDLPARLHGLGSRHGPNRALAVEALGEANLTDAQPAPVLVQMLSDPDLMVRREAFAYLTLHGGRARACVPQLVRALADLEPWVSHYSWTRSL